MSTRFSKREMKRNTKKCFTLFSWPIMPWRFFSAVVVVMCVMFWAINIWLTPVWSNGCWLINQTVDIRRRFNYNRKISQNGLKFRKFLCFLAVHQQHEHKKHEGHAVWKFSIGLVWRKACEYQKSFWRLKAS